MIFGRTEVIIGASKAKKCEESAGDVRLCVSPQKPSKIDKKRMFETEKTSSNFFWRRKVECWESSETRFPQVSNQTEPCSRGKRPFKVSEKNRNSRSVFPIYLGHRW